MGTLCLSGVIFFGILILFFEGSSSQTRGYNTTNVEVPLVNVSSNSTNTTSQNLSSPVIPTQSDSKQSVSDKINFSTKAQDFKLDNDSMSSDHGNQTSGNRNESGRYFVGATGYGNVIPCANMPGYYMNCPVKDSSIANPLPYYSPGVYPYGGWGFPNPQGSESDNSRTRNNDEGGNTKGNSAPVDDNDRRASISNPTIENVGNTNLNSNKNSKNVFIDKDSFKSQQQEETTDAKNFNNQNYSENQQNTKSTVSSNSGNIDKSVQNIRTDNSKTKTNKYNRLRQKGDNNDNTYIYKTKKIYYLGSFPNGTSISPSEPSEPSTEIPPTSSTVTSNTKFPHNNYLEGIVDYHNL